MHACMHESARQLQLVPFPSNVRLSDHLLPTMLPALLAPPALPPAPLLFVPLLLLLQPLPSLLRAATLSAQLRAWRWYPC